MTSYTTSTLNYPQGSNTPIKRVYVNRPPTSSDVNNFIPGDEWLDKVGRTWWKLVNSNGPSGALWIEMGAQSGATETLTGNSGGPVGPDGSLNINIVGAAGQVNVVGDPLTNTLTVGLTGGSAAIDTIAVDDSSPPGTNPVTPDADGLITVTGAQVAAGVVGANVIKTDSAAANTYTIEIQQADAVAAEDTTKNGVAHFNSNQFSISNGFVSLTGGGAAVDSIGVDTFTGPGTNPVAPDGSGLITVTGGQTAPGTIANVIRTDSLAANTYTVEIQQTSVVAAKDTTKNGVAHFNSIQFTNDEGFISIVGGDGPLDSVAVQAHTAPGTNPVLANGAGQITVNGGTVVAGTTPVQTNSLAANTYTMQVQTSQAIASTDATKIGLAAFNSSKFSVDANGFVSTSTLFSSTNIQVFTTSGTYTPTSGMKYCIIECIGGGGGGGGCAATTGSQVACGGGGAGGGYSRVVSTAATVGASQTVTIGAAGAGGVNTGGNGGTGGTTSLGAICSATGGTGGNGSVGVPTAIASNGGSGGVGTSGAGLNTVGGYGNWGWGMVSVGFSIGGTGGSSSFGGGALGAVHTLGAGGTAGGLYGGGGSGAANAPAQATGFVGGAGSAGVCVVTEFIA